MTGGGGRVVGMEVAVINSLQKSTKLETGEWRLETGVGTPTQFHDPFVLNRRSSTIRELADSGGAALVLRLN